MLVAATDSDILTIIPHRIRHAVGIDGSQLNGRMRMQCRCIIAACSVNAKQNTHKYMLSTTIPPGTTESNTCTPICEVQGRKSRRSSPIHSRNLPTIAHSAFRTQCFRSHYAGYICDHYHQATSNYYMQLVKIPENQQSQFCFPTCTNFSQQCARAMSVFKNAGSCRP